MISETPPFSEFAGWAGLVIAIVGVLPRLVSTLTRGKVGRFESILQAQDKQLANYKEDCAKLQDECDRTEKELSEERVGRARDREGFYQQMSQLHNHIYECEGILRRNAWKDPRTVKRERGGQK